jgi:hypothetical protein
VRRQFDMNFLIVTIGARVKIGPGDVRGIGIISFTQRIWVDVAGMKMMRSTDAGQRANRRAQIHVITSHHEAAARATEPRYCLAILGSETLSDNRLKREMDQSS